MSGVHWADDHVDLLRAKFAELATVPVYVRLESEVPGIERVPDANAWTHRLLDVRIRPTLEPRGEWFGRGVAIVIEDVGRFFSRTWPQQLATLTHELAHVFESWDSPERHDDRQWTAQDEWLAEIDNINQMCAELQVRQFTFDDVARIHHGPRFARAALHAWWRVRSEISLEEMHVFLSWYGSPDAGEAIAALDDELRTGGSILDIMRTPMPVEFAKLWT